MKGSCYSRFCEGKLPKKFQKRAEGFASVADTVAEIAKEAEDIEL